MYYFEQKKTLVAAVVLSACDFLKYWRDNGLKDNLVFKTKHNNKNKNKNHDDDEKIICISSILFNEVIKPVEIAFDVDCFNNVWLILFYFIFFSFCHLVWGFDSHLIVYVRFNL